MIKPRPLNGLPAKGFSLIELMIVIIVLAVLTSYSLALMQIKSRQRQVDQTVVALSKWLEAGLNYFAENNQWPEKITDLTGDKGKVYMPSGVNCSPWYVNLGTLGSLVRGNPCTADSGSKVQRSPYVILSSSTDPSRFRLYFSVGVAVPDQQVAYEVAKQLPVGQQFSFPGVAGAPVFVSASVPIPGMPQGWLVSGGTAMSGDQIGLPNCPGGYEGHYMSFPSMVTTGNWGKKESNWLSNVWGNIDKNYGDKDEAFVFTRINDSKIKYDEGNGLYYISPHDDNYDQQAGYQERNYPDPISWQTYLTFCLPQGQWQVKVQGADRQRKQDFQCDASWSAYNNHDNKSPRAYRC